jgi:hypothetical protein
MITRLKEHSVLKDFIEDTCCENTICISIDETISEDMYAIIKVDNYYNSLNLGDTPPSVDCLIIRKCLNGGYGLTLVELKNINRTRFDRNNMSGKFITTLEDFIKVKFREVLDIDYKDVKLYFVSKQELYKRDAALKLDVLMGIRFKFNGKTLMIQPKMPTPTILNCY